MKQKTYTMKLNLDIEPYTPRRHALKGVLSVGSFGAAFLDEPGAEPAGETLSEGKQKVNDGDKHKLNKRRKPQT